VGLRAFEDADLAGVRDLIHRTIDACYPAEYPPRAVAFFKEFHSLGSIRERARAGCIVVVERGGRVVATGALVHGEVTGVFVDPESQGEGLGAIVMDELEALAARGGRTTLRLSVSLPSRGFYARRGYHVLEERAIDVGEGQSLKYWEAEKSLPGEA
jgi:ribosomal protein S18 acetylase RimI-like enzyme